MSAAGYPIIGPGGAIQLEAVVRDGELYLSLGRAGEPGSAELLSAITRLVDYVNTLGADVWPHERRAAGEALADAAEALWCAGQVAA